MENNDIEKISFMIWEKSFRQQAKSDSYEIFRAHLKSLKLPDEPFLLLEGTILFVQTCVCYLMLDNQSVEEFLAHQQYDPSRVPEAPYLVTFNIHGEAFARINTPKSFNKLDFADLYGTPWDCYRCVGYNQFWISRTDKQNLSLEEINEFDDAVSSDLHFDYEEDELEFGFDADSLPGILIVTVQDAYEELESDF